MTKHEKIQEAYGELFTSCEKYIDENGWLNWCHKKASLIKYMDVSEIDFDGIKQRPKSLQGIENNNGWTKIESEDDLPKTDLECYVTNNIGRIQFGEFEAETQRFFVNDTRTFPTHYIPVVKPIFPIY